ncbi:MAG: CZB domain-containing protein [Opitutae bacterium]|nr:CZB domain-containing protein [Opitutae bacterium]
MPNEIFDQVTVAIGAHRQWKQRLQSVIDTGQSTLSAADVCADNHCDFGRWLYSLPPAGRNSAHWRDVQKLHACFHQEAGNVLDLALRGDKAGAQKRMAFGGSFAAASANLTGAMMKWKAAATAAA